MTETGRFWEDFAPGERYPTSTRKITETDLDRFCALVGYDVPLFVDPDKAAAGEFGGRICPSHLIMSFATAMTGRLFAESLIALLGLENGKFLAPVHPGDSLSTEVEVVDKRLSANPARGIVVFRDHVLNQEGTEVFRIDKITLLKRRESC
jgi:acyl dehydratase